MKERPMAMEEQGEFEFESYQDREAIAKLLKEIVDGLSAGLLFLGSKKSHIYLELADMVKVKAEGSPKEGFYRLKVKLEWKERQARA
ncbi:MAG: amphi-Trp domain-containing protein [Nitrospinae bacterium]|nr:amphi-Trp domain-containing protein [Nitrospinota bacterium]